MMGKEPKRSNNSRIVAWLGAVTGVLGLVVAFARLPMEREKMDLEIKKLRIELGRLSTEVGQSNNRIDTVEKTIEVLDDKVDTVEKTAKALKRDQIEFYIQVADKQYQLALSLTGGKRREMLQEALGNYQEALSISPDNSKIKEQAEKVNDMLKSLKQ